MTEKLYDLDSFITEFDATVISCTPIDKGFEIVLDKTAFFPESGGQYGDKGKIGESEILDTYYKGEEIVHQGKTPVEKDSVVHCSLFFEERFRKMQNHTAEHIVSSLIHRKYGFNNVGFHLSREFTTCDFNGLLTSKQLSEIEFLANKAVYENVEVICYYPEESVLETLDYRSKGELEGKVRIVEIKGIDMCACCAPHVKYTGQIGVIKILGFIKYKNGIRITMKSGYDAYEDYRSRAEQDEVLSSILSAPQNDLVPALKEKLDFLDASKAEGAKIRFAMSEIIADSVQNTNESICKYVPMFGIDDLRKLCNLLIGKTEKICAAISDADDGYLFVCESKDMNLRNLSKKISTDLNGKCGGSETMISGKLNTDKESIIRYFEKEMYND
ncbi:MAG: alanyl-tRNA editing protein [Clostridiales bacterium]|nr:alanyl-tRNA editing protein [Clostridiales bacterium]